MNSKPTEEKGSGCTPLVRVRKLFAEWTCRDASFRSVRRMTKPEIDDEFVAFCGSRGTARLGVRVIEVSSMEVRCVVESGNSENRSRLGFEVNGFTIGNYRRNILRAVKWGHFRFFPANAELSDRHE